MARKRFPPARCLLYRHALGIPFNALIRKLRVENAEYPPEWTFELNAICFIAPEGKQSSC
jgi:hypothetical protein